MIDEKHEPTPPAPEMTTQAVPRTKPVFVLLAVLFVAVVVAIVFLPVLDCQALALDDAEYLTENPLVTNPGWNATKRFLVEVLEPSTVGGYYQPLAMISLMVDYALGARPDHLRPIQRTSLMLHVANSALVTLFMLALFRSVPAAVCAGLLFGLHPTAVETVPWLAQRKSLLATLFALGCFVAYCRYARSGGVWRYAIVVAMYVLSLMSKPTSTPLPVLLLLLDWWPLNRLARRALIEKIPLLAVGAIFAVITVVSQSRTGGAAMPTDYGPWRIPMMLAHNIVFYVRQLFLPGDLPGYYIFPNPFTPGHPAVIAGFVGTALLVAALVLSLRVTKGWLCGWLFFFIAIFPTLGVIGFTETIAANRFVYLPMIGILLPIGFHVRRVWLKTNRRNAVRAVTAIVLLLVVGAEGAYARRGLSHWRDSITYFAHLAQVSPDASKVHYSYGEALDRSGRTAEAAEQYRAAIALKSDYAQAHNNLAVLLAAGGRLQEALPHYQAAIDADPASFKAYNNYGVALIQGGRTEAAVAMFERAVALNPAFVDARFNLGHVLAGQNRVADAIVQLQEAHRLRPTDAEILYNLAQAFELADRPEDALDAYRHVRVLDPAFPGIEQRVKEAEKKNGAPSP